jgi:hypothetical protein
MLYRLKKISGRDGLKCIYSSYRRENYPSKKSADIPPITISKPMAGKKKNRSLDE